MSPNPPSSIPYMSAPGSIVKILEKIRKAETPPIFSSDFLKTKLGFKGGNYRTFISWAKKTGLLSDDGAPTALYKKYRNSNTSKIAIADALKIGYSELYSRDEYCHALSRNDFKGLVLEATGDPENSRKVEFIVSSFFNVKELADFDTKAENPPKETKQQEIKKPQVEDLKNKVGIGLNYTINLTLPKTDDPAVYNAIFKSLGDNLLNK